MKRILAIFVSLLLTAQVFAAFTAATIWECATTGASTNGGGFDPVTGVPGVDYTQGAGVATFAYTDIVIGGTTTTGTSVARAFVANDVGNTLNVVSGTGFTVQRVLIKSVAAGVATFDKSLGTTASTGGTGTLGGALALPNDAAAVMVGGNICYIKSGTYTLTATQTFTLTPNIAINFVGYNTTRTIVNTDSTRPLITTATNSVSLFTFSAANAIIFRNLTFTTTAGTKAQALVNTPSRSGDSAPLEFRNCKWSTAFPGVVSMNSSGSTFGFIFSGCEITGTTTAPAFQLDSSAILPQVIRYCYIHACAGGIFSGAGANPLVLDHNIITDNTARGVYISNTTGSALNTMTLSNNTIANNTTANMEVATTTGINGIFAVTNNIFYGSAATLKLATAGIDKSWVAANNAFGGGGSTQNWTTGEGDITLSGDPFTSAGTGDYSLNNTAGAGASCRGAGYPQTFAGGTTTSRMDLGAAQHTESVTATQTSYSF